MMGVETTLLPGMGDVCFPMPPFKSHSRRGRPSAPVSPASARSAARLSSLLERQGRKPRSAHSRRMVGTGDLARAIASA